MGNFGKRILIVLISVLAIVALTLVGNAYQQAEKNHKVSNSSSEVYKGSFNGHTYSLTKKDVWNNIINSSPLSVLEEIIDKKLLASEIESITDEDVINAKIEELKFGTKDADKINKLSDEEKEKIEKSFKDKLTILGYDEDGKDYAKLMIAYENYARYRLENNLPVGGVTYDFSDEELKKDFTSEAGDVYALVVRFNSEKEATNFFRKLELVVVSSQLRVYVGDSEWILDKNSDSNYYLDENGYPVLLVQEDIITLTENDGAEDDKYYSYVAVEGDLEHEVGETVFIAKGDENLIPVYIENTDTGEQEVSGYTYKIKHNVPNANINQSNSKYRWDEKANEWIYNKKNEDTDEYEITSNAVSFDRAVSFTTSNTAVLNDSLFLEVYIQAYNTVYEQLRNFAIDPVETDSFANLLGLDLNTAEGVSALNDKIAKYEYVCLLNDEEVPEIRKYVGNSEYVLKVTDGKVESENGYPKYVTYGTDNKNLPNYEIELDSDGNPALDSANEIKYILDDEGNKKANASKVTFDECTEFTFANTVKASLYQLYSLYVQLIGNDIDASEELEKTVSEYLYNKEDLTEKRSSLATALFDTLKFGESSTSAVLLTATSYASGSDSAYYVIAKFNNSEVNEDAEPTAEELAEIKKNKIDELVSDTSFVAMAANELRKDAKIKFYDTFLVLDYKNGLAKDETNNKYGLDSEEDYEDYYKAKGYKASKLVSLKKVDVMGKTVDGFTVTADDLYDYQMERNAASILANTAINKYLLEMDDFKEIHEGEYNKVNYLTSKNWKLKQYAETTQMYNYQFEYYKNAYMQMGYDWYDSVEEFLYSQGVKSFDDMVNLLERSTMRYVLLANYYLGGVKNKELSEAALADVFGSDKWASINEDYLDVYVNHMLIYVDLDDNGSYDDLDDFKANFDEYGIKKEDGTLYTLDEYLQLINELYDLAFEYVLGQATFGTSSAAFTSFVTKYNESSILDSKYAKFKKVGIRVMSESLDEVTTSSVGNYVKEFSDAIKVLKTKLVLDKDTQGYSFYDGAVETSFGFHFITATAGSNFDVSFKFEDENNEYTEGVNNENDAITNEQLALYIQEYCYAGIYGTTDNPQENAGFPYPNLPAELVKNIELVYGDFLTNALDKSSSYYTNYLMLKSQVEDNNENYKASFEKLLAIYADLVFGDLD